ncbi:MAG: protoporphyrinogen oxidase [Planctomycetia bacterium]|nr:protoporphyrinogen oxidase [Planctomycetia bacterium]
MKSGENLRVAVVGGGISGLAAAFWLRENCPNVEVKVFEKRSRLGGVLNTEIRDGFEIEQSADNFITTMPWGLDLCKRIGLEDDIVTTSPNFRQTFVVWRNRLHKLPDGFMMMAPTKWLPMAFTPLLSIRGKIRAAMEYFLPPKKGDEDESLENFAVRRLGREAFEKLIEPLVSGVYAADMSRLSLAATLPRFRQMEKEYGSLIRAMRAARRKTNAGTNCSQSGPRYGLFVTIRGGLKRIIDQIARKLPPESVHLETSVTSLKSVPEGWRVAYSSASCDPGADEKCETFDAVILAAESHNDARLAESANLPQLAHLLDGIDHTGTVVMTAAFKRSQIKHPLDGMGAVVAGVEKSPILALSFSNQKYPHRAPEGYSLIRIFSGGYRNPEVVDMPEEEMRALLLEKTASMLRIEGEPTLVTTSRWARTMPQFHLGHLERMAQIEAELAHLPSLALAGNSFTGVGIPQCVHSGELAAQKIARLVGVEIDAESENHESKTT